MDFRENSTNVYSFVSFRSRRELISPNLSGFVCFPRTTDQLEALQFVTDTNISGNDIRRTIRGSWKPLIALMITPVWYSVLNSYKKTNSYNLPYLLGILDNI
ncbi:hypothetical protein WN55_09843 [Dufourea novaeangliae]|uniref:Uncharacterized protein n=1 Tax=Dufourea novaeangliae TaxID=178035 RepID=A0A154P7K5_DUFNO|nr:hypothetical protein WN55_09843 [Dufourea novaeangliae]